MQATLDALADDPRTLHLAVELALAERRAGERALVLVDQFEEVFTLCHDDAQRRQLFANLLYAATAPGGRGVVIVTMRADFYARCAAYPELAQLLTAQQMLVGPMDADGLRQAIEEPARASGWSSSRGWRRRSSTTSRPSRARCRCSSTRCSSCGSAAAATHADARGVPGRRRRRGALAQRADEVYAALDARAAAIARRVLLRLTQPGEGTEDTRRRATRSELRRAPADAGVDVVLDRLVDARLLTTGRDETGARSSTSPTRR